MEVAAGAMSPLLRKLGELLVGEITLERRVREGVASLQREMASMHPALRRVAEVPPDRLDDGVARWASELRELSYDMEDAVDAFMVRVVKGDDPGPAGAPSLRSRVRGFLKKTARLFGSGRALHQIAGAVGDAQSLAHQLGELRQRYGRLELPPVVGASTPIEYYDPRLTAMFAEAAELVGVDGSRDELIRMLSPSAAANKQEHLKTVSIVGFGGLGKTTLAKAVYDRVKARFDCGAFVSVSRAPDITKIFKKMLHQLDDEKYAGINEASRDAEQLITELRGFLQDKRFLVVIDDVWDGKHWGVIRHAFPKNNLGSAVITTTRILSVSEACCSSLDDKVYKMKPLSDSDSRRLFYTRVFQHPNNGCPPELEQVSRDILKKCGGIPLAIVSVASLLATRGRHNQIKLKHEWRVVLSSIGRGLAEEGGTVEDMQTILSYSYYDLPSHLKTCLLYLGVFPEDHDIGKERLIWRWIAEGFVQQRRGEEDSLSLYEVGESYYDELMNRSMVQPVGINFEGVAQACRVHDMMLDLIVSISARENFVTVWDGAEHERSATCKLRRLSIQNATAAQPQPAATSTSLSGVRSFTAFNPAIDSLPSISEFQALRVLDLEGCDLKKCGGHFRLRHIGDLSQLRYLGLRRTCIRELPVEIGRLRFLQTLDVRGSNGLHQLPATVAGGLRKLMCLRLDWETRLPMAPVGLSNLASLEELTGLGVGHGSGGVVRELGCLTGLRVLTIRWEDPDWGEALVECLGNLRQLQSLVVYVQKGGRGELMGGDLWAPPPGLCRFASGGPDSALPALPAWVSATSLPRLTFLDVWVDQVRRGDLDALGELPALLCLRLRLRLRADGRVEDRATERFTVRAGAFPRARACAFMHFATAPSMFPRGAMPRVQHLEFSVLAWDVAGEEGGGGLGLDELRMDHLPSLEHVRVALWHRKEKGEGRQRQVEEVAAALRRAADVHPNRPALRIDKKSA